MEFNKLNWQELTGVSRHNKSLAHTFSLLSRKTNGVKNQNLWGKMKHQSLARIVK